MAVTNLRQQVADEPLTKARGPRRSHACGTIWQTEGIEGFQLRGTALMKRETEMMLPTKPSATPDAMTIT